MITPYKPVFGKPASRPRLSEETDTTQIIAELINTDWGKDNESQGKASQLFKGLAFSDDPKANEFMADVDAFTNTLKDKYLRESSY